MGLCVDGDRDTGEKRRLLSAKSSTPIRLLHATLSGNASPEFGCPPSKRRRADTETVHEDDDVASVKAMPIEEDFRGAANLTDPEGTFAEKVQAWRAEAKSMSLIDLRPSMERMSSREAYVADDDDEIFFADADQEQTAIQCLGAGDASP